MINLISEILIWTSFWDFNDILIFVWAWFVENFVQSQAYWFNQAKPKGPINKPFGAKCRTYQIPSTWFTYLFLDPLCSKSLFSRSDSSLRGLPLRERGDSDTPIPVPVLCGSLVDPLHFNKESEVSREFWIFWTKYSRVSCAEDGALRWSWSCLASSLPCVNSLIRLFCSQSAIFSI